MKFSALGRTCPGNVSFLVSGHKERVEILFTFFLFVKHIPFKAIQKEKEEQLNWLELFIAN